MGTTGPNKIKQAEHLDDAQSRRVTKGILIPGRVIAPAVSIVTAGREVGKGNICRLEVSADTYVAFGEGDIAAVTIATTPAIKLAAGVHLIVATGDFIRASLVQVRLEIIS